MILLRRTGEILALNPGARKLLTEEECAQVAEFASRGLDTLSDGRVIGWRPSDGKPARLLWLTPLTGRHTGGEWYALAICDTERAAEIAPEVLSKLFRLTKAELRLALQMMHGRTPAEAACEMEVTIHTVRTYLKRLFLKMGVKTQAALVRKLLQTAAMPHPPN